MMLFQATGCAIDCVGPTTSFIEPNEKQGPMKRVTMSDVADQAGVSKTTVSHVINNTRFVEPETRERVMEAIGALNYRPSLVARSLVSKRTNTVGLLISDVSNPFYHQVIIGVEDVALANNY